MAHLRDVDPTGLVRYRIRCDHPGCARVHTPPLASRRASDARYQARHAGWRAPERDRHSRDRCPTHNNRKKTR